MNSSPVRKPVQGQNKILARGQLNQKRCPTQRTWVKVPTWVIELVEQNAEVGANKAMIYTYLIDVAAQELQKRLVLESVDINI
jgi:hypothetical protein